MSDITTWQALAQIVEEYSTETWIFRGVSNKDHALVPKIGRVGARKDKNGNDRPFDKDEERKLLERFQRETRPFMTIPPSSSITHDWDLQAVAQHHGLKTRLLDWSESPLIAAFFAVEPAGQISGKKIDAALYGAPRPY